MLNGMPLQDGDVAIIQAHSDESDATTFVDITVPIHQTIRHRIPHDNNFDNCHNAQP
jgi:hypothetical protein